MFRGTTVRIAMAALVAVLLALPCFADSPAFASAHPAHPAEARAQSTEAPSEGPPSGTAPRDESVSCVDTGALGGPAGPLRVRDRHRTANGLSHTAGHPPLTPGRALTPPPVAPGAAHPRTPRPTASLSPAALQVFRC